MLDLEQRRTSERRNWAEDAKAARERLERLERTEGGLLRRYREGAVSEGALDSELAEIRRHRAMTRRQLDAAERAQAGIALSTGRLAVIRDGMALLCGRIAQASPHQVLALVRALIARGGAVLDGRRIRLTLLVVVAECDSVQPSI